VAGRKLKRDRIRSEKQFRALMLAINAKELSQPGSFAQFCKDAWHVNEPQTELIWNWHLDAMAAYIEAYALRTINRLILNVPPGSLKSMMVAVFMPAWVWTWDDSRRFINLTNEIGLGTRDSRRMRDIVKSEWYQARWPHVQLSVDQKEKSNFENTNKGFRMAIGFGGNISGKRGTDLLIDDPIDTKKAFSDAEIATVNDTYDQAVSSRLNDLTKDGIIVIMQRTRTNDLTGHLLAKTEQNWVHFKIAMESEGVGGYDPQRDIGTLLYASLPISDNRKNGELMFPERFPESVVKGLKEDLGDYGTAGQLNQRPVPLGGGIIKDEYWTWWPEDTPLPIREHVFVSWDTAFTDRDVKSASYSAATVWGIFWHEQKQRHCMMVLSMWYGRVSYPDLRAKAMFMTEHYEPDCHLIEKKASGSSLVQDLKRAGSGRRRVRLRTYRPDRDKVSRANTATAVMAGGVVYVPPRKWARELVRLVGLFPAGPPESSDVTDTVTQAVLYLKKGLWVSHPDDDDLSNRMAEVHDEDYHEETEGMYG